MTMYVHHAGYQLEAILSPAFGLLGLHLGIGQQICCHRFHIPISVWCWDHNQVSWFVTASSLYTESSLPSPLFCFCEIQSEVTQASLKFLILLISLPEYEPTFDLCNSGDQINPSFIYARQALY